MNSIWMQIWQAWSVINYYEPNGYEAVKTHVLWLNSHIKRINDMFIITEMINADINTIQDIYDFQRKRFMTRDEVNRKYNVRVPYLEYFSLIACIPNNWKVILNSPNMHNDVIYISAEQFIRQNVKLTCASYAKLMQEKIDAYQHPAKTIWETELKIVITQKRLEKININTFKVTTAPKLRMRQYRIINKILTRILIGREQNMTKRYC